MIRIGKRALAPAVALLCIAPAACSKDDSKSSSSGETFKSFEPAAVDSSFSEPRDAVPLDNGGVAFIARANGSNVPPDDAPTAGDQAAVNDSYAVFVSDSPKAAPRIIVKNLIAPFNMASDGKDTLWVADIGGGDDGQGAVLQISIASGSSTPLAAGFHAQGLATDKAGKVYFTGKDPSSNLPGVFHLDGTTPVVTGGQFVSPSGLDIADDGTIYVADPAAGRDLDDGQINGSGQGVVFKVVGTTVTVVTAGFEAGYPTGIAIGPDGRIIISAYKDRGQQSAIILVDPKAPASPSVITDKLEDTFSSAGLHRSRTTGLMAWSGGNTVYSIQP
jgi:hypothetical protein